jgi:hypothetical protein
VEQSDDVVYLVCSSERGVAEVMASILLEGKTLILNQLHIDGPGANAIGIRELRGWIREIGGIYNAEWVEIRGGVRTTGSRPGHAPRPIRMRVR